MKAISDHLKGLDQRWPGLDWGPVQVDVDIAGDTVIGKITDVAGNVVQFPSIQAR